AEGEPLEAQILESRFPAEVLDSVERRGLLASHRDGDRLRLRLANPVYRHVLQVRPPVLRSRAIRRELSDALAQVGMARRHDALRIARWRLDSDGSESPELMLRAAREALAIFD